MDGHDGGHAMAVHSDADGDRGSRASEAGVSLIEVMVALAILTVMMTAVAMSMTQAMVLTGKAQWHEIAANVATAEMEQLRLADPRDVPAGTEVLTRSTSLGDVTVERTAEWIPADAAADACQAPTDSPRDLLRVTVDVVSPDGRHPTSSTQTVLTPDVGSSDLDRGHLAVRLLDRDARPPHARPLVKVSGGPSHALRTGMVSAEGCLFVDHLEPGDYHVEVVADGVDEQAGPPVADAVVQVAATTPVQITYDDPTRLEATFTSQPGASLPEGIDVVVRNTALLPDERRDVPGSGVTRVVEPLFPFASGYEVFASVGECERIDPAEVGLPRTLVETPADTTVEADVPLATVRLRTVNPGGQPVGGVTLRAVADADDGCDAGAELELGSTGASNELVVAVPPGTWSFRPPGAGAPGTDPVLLDSVDTVYEVEVRVGG